MRFLLPIVAVVLLSACGGSTSDQTPNATSSANGTLASDVTQITGQVNLAGGALNFHVPGFPNRQVCAGTGGYSDLVDGAGVTVKNENGVAIATGTLAAGQYLSSALTCSFPFVVDGVPRAGSYMIEVSHRAGPTYTYDDLSGRNWSVALSLGRPGGAPPT